MVVSINVYIDVYNGGILLYVLIIIQ